ARFGATLREVRALLRERRIEVVAGYGGYVCPPAHLTAAISRTPYVVHEANRRPGLANRLGAHRAEAVLTAFEGGSLPGARRIGMPMREAIAQLDRSGRRDAAVQGFGLDPDRPVMLVTGGSLGAQRLNESVSAAAERFTETGAQILHITARRKTDGLAQDRPLMLVTGGSLGAQRLNEALPAAAERFTESGAQILHITGRGKTEGLTERPGYRIVEYVLAMEDAYAAADLALTRAGAGTVSELTAGGLPAVLVPLPIGNGQQALNGQEVVTAGGALMVPDAELDVDYLLEQVLPLINDPPRLERMSRASRGFGIPDAAEV